MVSILIDDDLVLRSFATEDAQDLFNVVNSSRDHLRPWLTWVDATTKPEHTLQFIQLSRAQQHNQEGLALGIIRRRHIIGSVGMHHWNHELKRAQLGYWIAAEYEGKGIIQKCLAAFVDFLFNKAGLNKLEIRFMVHNRRSAAVAERMGFKVEGVIRQSYLLNGAFHDIVIAGLLKSEWPGLPQQPAQAFNPV